MHKIGWNGYMAIDWMEWLHGNNYKCRWLVVWPDRCISKVVNFMWDCLREKGPSTYIIKFPVPAIEM